MGASPSGKNKDSLVHVATAQNEAVAGMWTDILEDNGIRVLIKKDASYPYVTFNASCEIYVLTSQAVAAKQILDSLKQGDDLKANDEST